MPEEGTHRLPRSVEPEHYQLTFTVQLAEGTFAGEERITLTVHEPVAAIVLNALDLEIHEAELLAGDGVDHAGAVELRPDEEQAVITLAGPAPPGPYTLHLTFSGRLNDKLRGIYRSTFTDAEGVQHTIAATQFEPTDARRAFPCWDEPDRKATFATTLVVDKDLAVISNSALTEVTDLGEGRVQHEFAPTMRMSTYLVAFVVGALEATAALDVDGTPLRTVAVPGKQHLTAYAQDMAAHALRYFSHYFGLAYPGGKLDLIALPDFAMGAMENLGAVTFRENLLLIDPERATRAELERVALVIAHEIAHMWFGDLVTMRWWNGIWLNEAFATFMELLCVDAYRPEWQCWVTFGTTRDDAMVVDALAATRPVEFPVGRPEEAQGMFDVLTYQKGAAVLRMLERHVGADGFRLGISRYIAAHSHANTDTADLWDAVEAATGEPARSIMDTWILQGGFPIVSVALRPDGTGVELSQRRFRYMEPGAGDPTGATPGGPWRVPVHVKASVGGRLVHRRLLLDAAGAGVDLAAGPENGGGGIDWVVVNEGGWGFYRVGYDAELGRRLTSHLAELEALERLGLVRDTWAGVLAGETGVGAFLDLARLLAGDEDPSVWQAVLDGLVAMDRVIPAADRPDLQAFVRDLAGPALERIGWSPPTSGEDERAARLRAALIRALGTLGADTAVRARASQVHADAVADPSSVDADVAGAVVAVVAAGGGEAEYADFVARCQAATTPQEELRYLYALAGFDDPVLLQRTLAMALDDVRAQTAPFVITLLLANRAEGASAWDVVKQRWDDLAAKLPGNLHERALGGVIALSTPELAADVRAFLESHPIAGRTRTVSQLLERLDVAVALRLREGPRLGDELRRRAGMGSPPR